MLWKDDYMNAYIQGALKAFAAGIAAAAAYLVGVLGADGSFADITLVEWLGLIPVVAGVYGITWTVPNTPAE
jgi:hypothetical protein